jgi:hypothetical protein
MTEEGRKGFYLVVGTLEVVGVRCKVEVVGCSSRCGRFVAAGLASGTGGSRLGGGGFVFFLLKAGILGEFLKFLKKKRYKKRFRCTMYPEGYKL